MSNRYSWLPAHSANEMKVLDKKEVSGGIFIDNLTGITYTDDQRPTETTDYCHRCFVLNIGRKAIVTVNNLGYCKKCLEYLS